MNFSRSARWRVPTLLVSLFLLEASSLFVSLPAGAAPTTYTNPNACSATVQNGVCISSVSADYESSTITLEMTVGKATDPTSDPNWLNEAHTNVSWNIATGSATTASYVAEADSATNTPGTFSGVVSTVGTGGALTKACDHSSGVVVSFDLSKNQYGLSFPPSCIGSATSLSVQAAWDYTNGTGTTPETAVAPGTAQSFSGCCSVTSDPTSTSSTTTSTSTSTTTSTTAPSSTPTTTAATTSTTAPVTAAATSTGSSGAAPATDPTLAGTGAGRGYPFLAAIAVGLVALGGVGRRVLRRRRSVS